MTEGTRLLAQGRPITLLDGEMVNVRYGMRGVALLEAEFGTLANLDAILGATGDRAVVGPLIRMLACGLAHAVTGGTRMSVAQLYDHLVDRLDPSRLREYEAAVGGALGDAFPPVEQPEERLPNGSGPRERATSPGAPASTSGSPASTSPLASSGT